MRIQADDHKARIARAQYIARPPLSLAKLTYEPSQAKVIFHTSFNPALGENVKVGDALQFLALATQFIPPQGVRLIHYYGLYSSRSRWKWSEWDHVAAHAPQGWRENHDRQANDSPQQAPACTVPESACRSSWARLIAQVYEVDPLICPRCGSRMKILAFITEPAEVKKILRHLMKIGRPPPDVDTSFLN